MTKPLDHSAALILVDIQEGLRDPSQGPRSNPDAEVNAGRLLAAWRQANRPLVHIQHLSVEPDSLLRPELPGVAIQQVVAPIEGEPVMTKSVNSAFIGTDLERFLRDRQIDQVVVAGLTANQCVETTARMAGNLGFKPILVSDATAAFDRTGPDGVTWPAATIHAVTLANLHGEFAEIATTDEVLARLG